MGTEKKTNRWQVWCYSDNADNDVAVRKAAGVDDFGSGVGFGKRDISFFAPTERHANKMKDRLLKVKGVSSVDIIDDEAVKNRVKTYWVGNPPNKAKY